MPVSRTVAPTLVASVQRRQDGRVVFRDLVATAGWRLVSDDTLTVVLRPGLRLPTGGLAEGLVFTPLSTASIDPWLSAEVVAGADWLFVGGLQGQVPLYAGWDDRRQGAYGRVDLRGARRIGTGVVWLGASGVGRTPDDLGQASFTELALTSGALWAIHQRASISGQIRVPLAASPDAPYAVGAGVGFTWVVGKPLARDDDEDDDHHGEDGDGDGGEHHEGDGHDHG